LSFECCDGVNPRFPLILSEQIQQFDLYLGNSQFETHETWRNLYQLSLSFEDCWKKESLVALFSDTSLTFKNLSELKFRYYNSQKIDDQQFEKLAYEIGTNLGNLTRLELSFSNFRLLGSESILSLSRMICSKLKKLHHLNLTFFRESDESYSKSFCGADILYLANRITSKLENLESLTLNFNNSVDRKEMKRKSLLDELCSLIHQNSTKLK